MKEIMDTEGQTGQIIFTAKSVETFRDALLQKGKLTPSDAEEVTTVLNEKGPREAMKELAVFLLSLPE